FAVPAIDRNTKRANCLDALTRDGAVMPGGVSTRQVVDAVVAEVAELLGSRDGALRRDAAQHDFAMAVGELVRDGGGGDEQRSLDAALVAGHLRADVDEQRARAVTAPRGRRRDGVWHREAF